MNKHKQNGFTIIEISLVIAIAGLIFVAVFMGIPALQRSQRDSQRRSDVAAVRSAIEAYKNNNDGQVPWESVEHNSSDTWISQDIMKPFVDQYMNGGKDIVPPSGGEYTVYGFLYGTGNASGWGTSGDWLLQIFVFANARCSSSGKADKFGTASYGTPRRDKYAVWMRLENKKEYCVDG